MAMHFSTLLVINQQWFPETPLFQGKYWEVDLEEDLHHWIISTSILYIVKVEFAHVLSIHSWFNRMNFVNKSIKVQDVCSTHRNKRNAVHLCNIILQVTLIWCYPASYTYVMLYCKLHLCNVILLVTLM